MIIKTFLYFNCSHYNRKDKHFVTLFTPAVGQKGQLNYNAMNFEIKLMKVAVIFTKLVFAVVSDGD